MIDEEINDEYCLDAHKYSPHETILVTTQHTDQLEVKEEIQKPETNQEDENNEKERVILDPMGVNISSVIVEQNDLVNHHVKLIEHIIEESFVDLQ